MMPSSNDRTYRLPSGPVSMSEPKKMAWGTYAKFVDTNRNEFLLKG
jgi:hypothetical protein